MGQRQLREHGDRQRWRACRVRPRLLPVAVCGHDGHDVESQVRLRAPLSGLFLAHSCLPRAFLRSRSALLLPLSHVPMVSSSHPPLSACAPPSLAVACFGYGRWRAVSSSRSRVIRAASTAWRKAAPTSFPEARTCASTLGRSVASLTAHAAARANARQTTCTLPQPRARGERGGRAIYALISCALVPLRVPPPDPCFACRPLVAPAFHSSADFGRASPPETFRTRSTRRRASRR